MKFGACVSPWKLVFTARLSIDKQNQSTLVRMKEMHTEWRWGPVHISASALCGENKEGIIVLLYIARGMTDTSVAKERLIREKDKNLFDLSFI